MKLQIALLLVCLIAGTYADQPLNKTEICYERITHLLDRAYYAGEQNLDVDGYLQVFRYLEDRLLHNKTYTQCYNYTNEMCQLATTNLLPRLFNYVKNNSTNISSARINYHYVQRTTAYVLTRCGLRQVLAPDFIEPEEFNRATCRHTSERIYSFLTALSNEEVHRMTKSDLAVLFRTFSTMFGRAHQRGCMNPAAYTPRVLFIGIRDFVAGRNFDKHILVELWRFISYLGVEYIRDAGLNQNITQICELEIGAVKNYLNQADGFGYFKQFSEHLLHLAYQTKCFKRTNQCRVFRQRLSETVLDNLTFKSIDQSGFNSWWSIIRFNAKQYIYDCYYQTRLDFANPIWNANYSYVSEACTNRTADVVRTLRGTFFTDVNKANITFPALYYMKTELNDLANECFNKNENCTNYRTVVNYLINRTLSTHNNNIGEDSFPAWDYDISGNFFLVQLNALKWVHHCTVKPSDVIIPKERQGCAQYVTSIRDGLTTASLEADLVDALMLVRENKKLIDLYRDCNIDHGASRLCLDLSEQVRSLYVKILFTSDIEEFRAKIRQVSEALKDVSDECKPLRN